MCAAPRRRQFRVDWLSVAEPMLGWRSPSPLRRVDDLVHVEVADPAVFERLPVHAEVLEDPLDVAAEGARRSCACCCHERRLESVGVGGPTILARQYLNDGPTRRWIRLAIPPANYARAVEALHDELGPALLRSMPVYRRRTALVAVRFDVLVGEIPGMHPGHRDAVSEYARENRMLASFPGGSMVVITARRPIAEEEMYTIARGVRLAEVHHQELPMRAAHGLGSPKPGVVRLPEGGVMARFARRSVNGREWSGPVDPIAEAPSGLLEAKPLYHLDTIGAAEASETDVQATEPVVVAVIDDLCNHGIRDLTDNLYHSDEELFEYGDAPSGAFAPEFDPTLPVQSHGTACAGVIAALPDPVVQTRGVAPRAKVLPLGIHEWYPQHVVTAIERVCEGDPKVRVLSLSLAWYEDELSDADFRAIKEALRRAHKKGILICAATGNVLDEDNADRGLGFPACLDFVMAVGAVTASGEHKEFGDSSGEDWASRYVDSKAPSSKVEGRISVVAPGVGISTSDSVDEEFSPFFNGTSAATPQVAGLAALLFQKYSWLKAKQVRYIIEATATKEKEDFVWRSSGDVSTRSPRLGYGRINVARALSFADLYVHDSAREGQSVPIAAAAEEWWSDDVRITEPDGKPVFAEPQPALGPLRRFEVYVRVWNAGPAKAENVSAWVWVIPDDGVAWELGADLSLGGVELQFKGEASSELECGESTVLRVSVDLGQAVTLTEHAYLLIAADATNDHAFRATLPAQDSAVLPQNNLTRVSLRSVRER